MSVDINQINIGQKFSFEVFPSAMLGYFRNVTLDCRLSANGARSFGVDVDALHANVYRTLPTSVPNDPNEYDYIRVRHPNGAYSVVGVPYIRAESIQMSTFGVLTLRFEGVNQQDQQRILNAVSASGYSPSYNVLDQVDLVD